MLLKDAAIVFGLSFDPPVIVSDFKMTMVTMVHASFCNEFSKLKPSRLLLSLHVGERYVLEYDVAI